MTKKNGSKYDAKEEFETLSFSYTSIRESKIKMYQVIF